SFPNRRIVPRFRPGRRRPFQSSSVDLTAHVRDSCSRPEYQWKLPVSIENSYSIIHPILLTCSCRFWQIKFLAVLNTLECYASVSPALVERQAVTKPFASIPGGQL